MGDRVISFADVIGDEREFFRRYFNKRIFYRPGGITGDPRQILSIADMDGKTLIHGGLNLTRPNLRALARSMTDRFAAKSEVVAFLTPAGQQGPRTAIQPMSMSSSWKERNGGRSGRRRRSGGRESANRLR